MKATLVLPIAVFSTLMFFYIRETEALKCYVCQDCAESFASEHIQNCSRNVDKCIKMHLQSGEVDRLCADKNEKHKCTGRGNGRNKRSIEDDIDNCLPKRRIVRQLLGGGDGGGGGGGGGSSSSNKGSKNKDKQKEEKKGVKDAVEIHCCGDDGCNGSLRLSPVYLPLLLISVFALTLFSNPCPSFLNFRYAN